MNDAATVAPPVRNGFGIGPDGTYTSTGQLLAFLFGLWTMVLFFPLLVPGALLYTRAEERFDTDPGRARTLVNWSWLCITALPVLAVVLIIAVIAVVQALT